MMKREHLEVAVWGERDRLSIVVTDRETGEDIAGWWDDDARSMFEDGFFKRGSALESSVLDYLDSMVQP